MNKLIITIATLGSGGAERVLSILSKPLADSFDEVQYVMWDGGEVFYQIDKRIKIISLPELSGKYGRKKQLKAYRQYIKQENPDLILSFLTPYNMLVLLSTFGLRKKIIVAERTDPKRLLAGGKPMLRLRDLLYRRASGILTQTEYAQSCYARQFPNKTHVIYNPILMSDEQVGSALRKKKEKMFVSVGRLESVKDQASMIEAFAIFHELHKDYRLVIYGEGPMRQNLECLINEKNLKGSVVLAGRCNQVWDMIVSAECFLLTSLAEGMSNAMIEALCLGLPVISTKVAGSTDFIIDGQNGFLVNIGDVPSLVSKMSLIADNPELRENMGEEAKKAYEKLNAEIICKQWVSYLQSYL